MLTSGDGSRFALVPRVAFSQGLLNLVDNAIEASGGADEVEVWVERSPGRVDVSVCDRGDGWPDVVKAHLGQPFVTTRPDRVGLGLYFVHTLSEAIGAEFHVENRELGGAVARISLPAAQDTTQLAT